MRNRAHVSQRRGSGEKAEAMGVGLFFCFFFSCGFLVYESSVLLLVSPK